MRTKVLRIVFSLILALGTSTIGLVPAAGQSCVGRVIDQGTVGSSEIFVFLVFCSDGSAYLIATVATENADGSLTFQIFAQPL